MVCHRCVYNGSDNCGGDETCHRTGEVMRPDDEVWRKRVRAHLSGKSKKSKTNSSVSQQRVPIMVAPRQVTGGVLINGMSLIIFN